MVVACLTVTLSILATPIAWSAITPVVPGVNWPDIVFDYAGNMYGTSGSTSPGPAVLRSLVSVNTVSGSITFGAPTVYSSLVGQTYAWPWGLAFDRATGDLYVSSTDGKVFKIPSGSTTASLFSNPGGYLQWMTIVGGDLYVADQFGQRIVKINLASGSFSNFVSLSGYQFRGLTTDGTVIFATAVNGAVMTITVPGGSVTTIATIPYYPEGIDRDGLGNLYVAARGYAWQIPKTTTGYGSPFIYAGWPIRASHACKINYFLYVTDSVYQALGAVFQVDLPKAASLADIEAEINLFGSTGWISNGGVVTALLSQCGAASSAPNSNTEANIIQAMIYFLQSINPNHILATARNILLTKAKNLLTRLQAPGDPIIGYVKDSTGNGVSEVYVTLYDLANHIVAQAITDVTGFYYFADTSVMTVGETYTVKATSWPSEYSYTTANPSDGQSFTWQGATVTSIGDITLQ